VARFRHGPLWNFSYLLACAETREAAVIDPAWDTAAILEAAAQRDLRITTVLLTHSHSDHSNGVTALVEASGARVFVHAADEPELRAQHPAATTFAREESLTVGRIEVAAHHSPGHTPGSVTYSAGGRIFTGDTITIASPGTPGPEAGSVEVLWQSTLALAALPAATRIHPGHDSGPKPSATLEEERLRNPALLARTLEEFRSAVERATGRIHR
jgi:glyoxylase-like metal-dependent hydrolase (beta-lactamase superfamily II)